VTTRGRFALLAACGVVAALVALYAAVRSPAPTTGPPPGSVRLGPESGESVAGYVRRAAAGLPPAGTTALALVQFADERTVGDVQAPGTPVEAVFRVDLPRVQTALRFMPLEPDVPVATALDTARQRAGAAAGADAARLAGRPHDVAVAEAAALARPDCPCVVALVVSADGAALRRSAAGVRVIEAAPPGVTLRELALSPLLPEQADRADPLPDDGRVP
jgi:hypothetical protein